MPQQHIDAGTLRALEEELTEELDGTREKVLRTYEQLAGLKKKTATVHSFHGKIGSKNNEYTDAIRTQFADPDDFIARWLRGLCDGVAADKAKGYERAATRLARILKNKVIREYTFKFLTRNFYRNLVERTRSKPDDLLWQLWFGDNKMTWGLFIAPAFREDDWTNDKSEIRRASYDYWTVGHVLETGIIDPDSGKILRFDSIEGLKTFYLTVLRRCSSSQYGPSVPEDVIDASRDMQETLSQCLEQISFLTDFPIRKVTSTNPNRSGDRVSIQCLLARGDHPGMPQESISVPLTMETSRIRTGDFYISTGAAQWIPLFPFMMGKMCQTCKVSEIYFPDRWFRNKSTVELKSFERGHTVADTDADEALREWIT